MKNQLLIHLLSSILEILEYFKNAKYFNFFDFIYGFQQFVWKKKDGKNYIFYTSQEYFSYFITNSIVLQLFSLKKYIYDLSMTGFEVVDLKDIKIISLLLIN